MFGLTLASTGAAGDRRAESLALTCFTCHNQPQPRQDGIPSLNALSREELIQRLTRFRNGELEATIMDRIASAYTDEEIALIADYISNSRGTE